MANDLVSLSGGTYKFIAFESNFEVRALLGFAAQYQSCALNYKSGPSRCKQKSLHRSTL
eukprot:m.37890 g.37890  ORF g.37890 m.37890 type:complete len:59 (-) comp17777_c0_seq1:602-778(-)